MSTQTQTPTPQKPTHLIILCCHAIYLRQTPTTPQTWLLHPFQTREIPTFTSHMRTSLTLLSTAPSSLLLISGSSTHPSTPITESQSYLHFLQDHNFLGLANASNDLANRIVLEEQALDSFGNLVFSIIGFWKVTGAWPEGITVVSHAFKRERFVDVHARVLGVGARMRFVGVDPEYMVEGGEGFDGGLAEGVREGERRRGLDVWRGDGWGVGEVLRGKRWGRNWWGVGQLFFEGTEERGRSGVRSRVVEFGWVDGEGVERRGVEEVLIEGRQPWMVDSVEI